MDHPSFNMVKLVEAEENQLTINRFLWMQKYKTQIFIVIGICITILGSPFSLIIRKLINTNDVNANYFFGQEGGFVMVYEKFQVGLDFNITMSINPLSTSGLLIGIQGPQDSLILEMFNNTIIFNVDNGGGAFLTIYVPEKNYSMANKKWYNIKAVKSKNVVLISIDDTFTSPGIGVPGISYTDTNTGFFIGGHPEIEKLRHLQSKKSHFHGCIKDIVIQGKPLTQEIGIMHGDIKMQGCLF